LARATAALRSPGPLLATMRWKSNSTPPSCDIVAFPSCDRRKVFVTQVGAMQLSRAPSAFLRLVTRASGKSTKPPANKTERRTTVALVLSMFSPTSVGGKGGCDGGHGGGKGVGGVGGGNGDGGEGGGEGGGGGRHASAKEVETMRLRIEMAQGGVEFVCRKATALIVVSAATEFTVMMRMEASEVGLTQTEHLSVTVSKL